MRREDSDDDDIQEIEDESADLVLGSTITTTTVGTQAPPKNFFKVITENKEIAKTVAQLSTYIASTKKDVANALDRFRSYQFIWQKDREQDLKEFLASEPKVNEFEIKIRSFSTLTHEINSYPDILPVSVIALVTERLKMSLNTEIQLWKNCYGLAANQKYKKEINDVLVFVEDATKRLQRDIRDLEDIKTAMDTLKEVRDNEIHIDMTIQPIEECYALLQKHEIPVQREEIERCDTLRYNWQKLLQLSSHLSGHLLSLQPSYKENLKKNVASFAVECKSFYDRYKKKGPMVLGVPPREASDRLFLFQNNFDQLFRKFSAYTNGEELFGMQITSYPELLEIRLLYSVMSAFLSRIKFNC